MTHESLCVDQELWTWASRKGEVSGHCCLEKGAELLLGPPVNAVSPAVDSALHFLQHHFSSINSKCLFIYPDKCIDTRSSTPAFKSCISRHLIEKA